MERRIWLVETGEYEMAGVGIAFETEELANEYVRSRGEGHVYDVPIHDTVEAQVPYWHFGADVYPDGQVTRWGRKHKADPGVIDPVDPGPSGRDGNLEPPWDGHTQSHCGYHVSVFGTDREAARAERERQVEHYLALANGTCPGCGRTGEPWYRGMDSTELVEVVLVGGPSDGQVLEERMPMRSHPNSEWGRDFGWGGWLVGMSSSTRCVDGEWVVDGGENYSYGQVERDGERWVRRVIKPKA